MAADPTQELHRLINQLGDDATAEVLAFARQLLDVPRAGHLPPPAVPARPHAVPTLHQAAAIASIDDLRAPLFEAEEGAQAFDETIQRWREDPRHA